MRREEKEETGREGYRGNTRRNGNGGQMLKMRWGIVMPSFLFCFQHQTT